MFDQEKSGNPDLLTDFILAQRLILNGNNISVCVCFHSKPFAEKNDAVDILFKRFFADSQYDQKRFGKKRHKIVKKITKVSPT
jgi:hypothetical protein